MKGLMIFSSRNDISYIDSDKEFTKHVNDLAIKQGLLQAEEVTEEIDPNAAVQLFSPLMASQRFMIVEAGNAYHSMRCHNDFLFVFKQFSEHIFMAVNGDGSETEEFLTRKLFVLHRIVAFFYGPVLEQLRPSRVSERTERWNFLSRILAKWQQLYRTQQSFLMEAIERLHVNQQLNSTCISLLETALDGLRAGGEKHAVHGLLVVNSKLLALYSSRNATELSHSDLLLMLLFSNALFPGKLPSGDVQLSVPSPTTPSLSSSTRNQLPVNVGASRAEMERSYEDRDERGRDERDGEGDTSDFEYYYHESSSSDEENNKGNPKTANEEHQDLGCPITRIEQVDAARSLEQPVGQSTQQREAASSVEEPVDNGASTEATRTAEETGELEEQGGGGLIPEDPGSVGQQLEQPSVSVYVPPVAKEGGGDGKSTEQQGGGADIQEQPDAGGEGMSKEEPEQTPLMEQPANLAESAQIEATGTNREISPLSDSPPKEFSVRDEVDMVVEEDQTEDANQGEEPHSRTNPRPNMCNVSESSPECLRQLTESYVFIDSDEERTAGEGEEEEEFQAAGSGKDHQQFTVMLNAIKGKYLPHGLHCLKILPGISLIIVKEMTTAWKCGILTDTLTTLRALLMGRWSPTSSATPQRIVDYLNTNIKRLLEILAKMKGSTYVEELRKDVKQTWQLALKADLLLYLETKGRTKMSPSLETCLGNLHGKLVSFFKMLFLHPARPEPERQQALEKAVRQVQHRLQDGLTDYMHYLDVKAQRNITISSYLDEFPGMVHFIYVDRNTDQLTAPAISLSKYLLDNHIYTHLKAQVWEKVGWIQGLLSDGHTSIQFRDGDFHYCYFLWFEDNSGTAMTPPKPFRGFETFTPPGILCNSFYSRVIGESFPVPPPGSASSSSSSSSASSAPSKAAVQCYELLTVHVGVMPAAMVLTQCRRLANRMWDTHGELHAPISLL